MSAKSPVTYAQPVAQPATAQAYAAQPVQAQAHAYPPQAQAYATPAQPQQAYATPAQPQQAYAVPVQQQQVHVVQPTVTTTTVVVNRGPQVVGDGGLVSLSPTIEYCRARTSTCPAVTAVCMCIVMT